MSTDDADSEDSQQTTDERPPGRSARSSAPRITGDRYRIGESIGRGGMGEVRGAYDEQIGREVAIKRIRAAEPTDRSVKRFLREARIQGRLEHPGIPAVHELGRDTDGMPYFVMKKLAGTSLKAILEATDRDPKHSRQRLLRAFADVCLAVEYGHVNGVLHRDLKPDNIVFGEFGEVYVIDWGVAKLVGEDDEFDDIRSDELQTRAGAARHAGVYGSRAGARRRRRRRARGCLRTRLRARRDPRPRRRRSARARGAARACHGERTRRTDPDRARAR